MNQAAQASRPAKLALEDGTVFAGSAIGADGEVDGEVCFNTSMTGYQEILTDPSYCGQIVTMTYPQIGNYGVNADDVESHGPRLSGFVVREHSRTQSNFRSERSLSEYLVANNVVAIESIDTRALVRRLRSVGSMRGVLSTTDLDDASLVAKAKASPGLVGRDLVREVAPKEAHNWSEPLSTWTQARWLDAERRRRPACGSARFRHEMEHPAASGRHGMPCHHRPRLRDGRGDPGPRTAGRIPLQRPRRSRADRLRHRHNPGSAGQEADLRDLPRASAAVARLRREDLQDEVRPPRRQPASARTCRPARWRSTSQNHGFAVDGDSLPDNLEVTHVSLNDQTIEGVRVKDSGGGAPAFSVQYHPRRRAQGDREGAPCALRLGGGSARRSGRAGCVASPSPRACVPGCSIDWRCSRVGVRPSA